MGRGTDETRGVPGPELVSGHGPRDHGAGADHRAFADRDPAQYGGPASDPGAALDPDGASGSGLTVHAGRVHLVTTAQEHHLVSQHHAFIENNRIPGVEQGVMQADTAREPHQMRVPGREYSRVLDV